MSKNVDVLPNLSVDLSRDDVVWRYMSLDKFIDLLETSELFFTPVRFYERTDPFEGHFPKPVMEYYAEKSRSSYSKLETEYKQLKEMADDLGVVGRLFSNIGKRLEKLKEKLDSLRDCHIDHYLEHHGKTVVSCWNKSDHESEALWKLYSDQNSKGVAIKTTIGSIVDAIDKRGLEYDVKIGKVDYLDYEDENLSLDDCFASGQSTPLMKRVQYSHENEVRAFIIDDKCENSDGSVGVRIKADVKSMIHEVRISPYVSQPFPSSVRAICKTYGIDEDKVKESSLLEGVEELIDLMKF